MAKGNFPFHAFNRGECSRLALGRTDVDRLRLSAEEQVNFLPMVLGPMMLRPGLGYLYATRSNIKPRYLELVFGNADTAALELTTGAPASSPSWAVGGMRVMINDAIVSRPGVNTSVTNGDFSSSTGWTLSPTINSLATAAISGGKLTLNARARGGVGYGYRSIIIPVGARTKEHAFRIVVDRGPVLFKCGTGAPLGATTTTDNIIATTELSEGVHSLAFTPTASQSTVYVYFETRDMIDRIVDQVTIESSGDLVLPTPWDADDMDYVRHAQSGDVVFVACQGVHPYRIERRGARSWSVVKYLSRNGPLKAVASVKDLKLTPGAMYGNTTLTADRAFFTEDHVGSLFRLFQNGQTKRMVLAGDDKYTDPIRITGVGEGARKWSIYVSGTFTGALNIQQSLEENADKLGIGFRNFSKPFVGPQTEPEVVRLINENEEGNMNNIIAFYRVGFGPTGHTNGAAVVEFRDRNKVGRFNTGGGAGFCRVTSFVNAQLVNIEIIDPLNSLNGTTDWQESEWSPANGYPSSVVFHDGRLWWAGGDKVWASVSDDYTNFDIEKEGDAGPILRSIGFGPVDTINWMLPLTRLILGREGSETSIRSSSFDEPLTPTSFTMKDCSTRGSARIAAIKCDTRGLFVGKSKKKLYELIYDVQGNDYAAHDLTRLNPDVSGDDGFTRLAIQFTPDTTVHCVRSDGQVGTLLYDKEDEVEAWWRVKTDGVVEDVFVLPGTPEDNVYLVVRRVINGSTVRYVEKYARRDQCSGLAEARLSDSHIVDTGGDRTITGLDHLEGETVVAWGWNNTGTAGVDLGSYVVANGRIVTTTAYNNVCVGLPYAGTFTSAKLAYAGDRGTAVNQKKRIDHLGLILYDTHYQGLKYGQAPRQTATVTMAAATDMVTDAAHGLQAGTQVAFGATGSLLTGLSEDVVYYVAHPIGINNYKLATSYEAAIDSGSTDRVALSGTQSGTHTRTTLNLDDLPQVNEGATISADAVFEEFDGPMIEVPGEWNTDSRLYLKAQSPRPCTVAAAVIGIETHG